MFSKYLQKAKDEKADVGSDPSAFGVLSKKRGYEAVSPSCLRPEGDVQVYIYIYV